MDCHLLLIRHSAPEIRQEQPAEEWLLSAEGRRRCLALAHTLQPYGPAALATSLEPKALETAQILGAQLDWPVEPAIDLNEHLRRTVGWLSSPATFDAAITRLFEEPRELVLGEETAVQALDRFGRAVGRILERYPEQTVAIVTHGTVMTLYVAQVAGVEPLPFWRALSLPALAVLARPQLDLVAVDNSFGQLPGLRSPADAAGSVAEAAAPDKLP